MSTIQITKEILLKPFSEFFFYLEFGVILNVHMTISPGSTEPI